MIDQSKQLVTVFGGGGFIGRYVCESLLRSGARIRVAQRNPKRAYAIQPLAQVGHFGFVQADLSSEESVRRAVDGATAVVNLCGAFGRQMEALHVDGAQRAAAAAREAGSEAFVQVSAIGADPAAKSAYGRSKGEGEIAVRRAFPQATIIRPSLVFGPEDQLTNRFAEMARLPVVPVLAAQTQFQPIYVRDLGQAVASAALDPGRFAGKTFELGGPQLLTMAGLHQAIFELSGQNPDIVELPDMVGSLLSKVGWLPGAPLTRDQWLMLQSDNVAAKGASGLEAFGIKPTPLAAVGHEWLSRFETGGKFASRRINSTATN